MRGFACLALDACSSSPAPSPTRPEAPSPVATTPDAAPDAAPDAGVPAEVAAAPAWIFKYAAPDRVETWTLRTAGGQATLSVERTAGTTLYLGTATDATTLQLAAGANRLALDCKRDKLTVCSGTKTKNIDVLNCYHPDDKAPMAFAAAGVELAPAGCKQGGGYSMIP